MNDNLTHQKIEDTLLAIVRHNDNPDIIFLEIDTGGSDLADEGIVPYLNLYGYTVFKDENLDNAIQTAITNDDFGFIVDILDNRVCDDFEIKLTQVYPNWPDDLDAGDVKILSTVKKTIGENRESFEHVRKLYFHYVDSYEFVKIIDKPA